MRKVALALVSAALTAAGLVTLSPAGGAGASSSGWIAGSVTNVRGHGIDNVTVFALDSEYHEFHAPTRADGSYRIRGVPAGRYSVCFEPFDVYHPLERNIYAQACFHAPPADLTPHVRVSAGQVRRHVDIVLARGARIAGKAAHVTDGFESIDLDEVQVFQHGRQVAWTIPTDSGHYSIGHLPAGRARVCVDPEYTLDIRTCQEISLTRGAFVQHVDFHVATGARVDGAVRDALGTAIPDATVTLTPSSGGSQIWATTASTGEYRIQPVPAGEYTICAHADGHTDACLHKPGEEATSIDVPSGVYLTASDLVLP